MTEIEVQIIELEPMRMVSAYGFGAEPEGIAWEKIKAFAQNKGSSGGLYHPWGQYPGPGPHKKVAV